MEVIIRGEPSEIALLLELVHLSDDAPGGEENTPRVVLGFDREKEEERET